ncbi:MAG: hypothetical protein KC731_04765 [Myxococcales bacterium]|nr:hypothetical protein [Myxococcales bacterium]
MRRADWVTFGLAVALLSACGPDCDECREIQGRIIAVAATNGYSSTCGPFDDPSKDNPVFAEACEELRDCLGDADACND